MAKLSYEIALIKGKIIMAPCCGLFVPEAMVRGIMKEMHILAVDHLGEDREALSPALAQALGITLYEARARIAVAGKGPVIVASFGHKHDADKKAEQLRASGINPLILSQAEIETDETRTTARTFILRDTELVIGTRTGKEVRMAYSGITLIIRGTRITQATRTETEKSTKFAPDRAIMSGGLMLTKSVKVTSTTSADVRDGFLHLYGAALQPIALLESFVLFDSLGQALQPTRTANFARLLGPLFTPEAHLDIAVSVLARSLRS